MSLTPNLGRITTDGEPCGTTVVPTTVAPQIGDYNYWIETYWGNCCSYRPYNGMQIKDGVLQVEPIIMFGQEKWNGTSWELPACDDEKGWQCSGPLSAETWKYKAITVEPGGSDCGEDVTHRWYSKLNRFTEREWTGYLLTGYIPWGMPETGANGLRNQFNGYIWGQQGGAGQVKITGYSCCGVSEVKNQGSSFLNPSQCFFPERNWGFPEDCAVTLAPDCPNQADVSACDDLVNCSSDDQRSINTPAPGGFVNALDHHPCCATCAPCTTVAPPTTLPPTTPAPTTCLPEDCCSCASASDCVDGAEYYTRDCLILNGQVWILRGADTTVFDCATEITGPDWELCTVTTPVPPTTLTPATTICPCDIPEMSATPDPNTMCRDFSKKYYEGDCQTIYNNRPSSPTLQWERWKLNQLDSEDFITVSAWMAVNCSIPSHMQFYGYPYWEFQEACPTPPP